ncbi:NAD(P)-dependent oxidoreductase [Neisseria sp.]|uniref:NAD(P)-dependent oxidoreductase n=1 Tax=Neisseria sp. TaxID=192066 RepID=UPI0035A09604
MSKQNTTRIGWIGLGQMGVPMVTRLLDHGIETGIFNRSPDKGAALLEKGAKPYTDAAALLRDYDTVVLMVSDYAAVNEIVEGVKGGLAGKTIVNMSTIAPSENLKIKALVEANGGRFAEAPVSGSVVPATNGTLLILFGGDADVLAPLQNVFAAMGQRTFHFGGVGKGSGAKLVLNSLLGIFGEAYAEAMLMGEAFGIDLNELAEAVGGSAMNSPMFQTKKPLLLNKEFPAAFMLKHAAKDLKLAVGELSAAGASVPAVELVSQNYTAAAEAGLGGEDVAGIYRYLAKC